MGAESKSAAVSYLQQGLVDTRHRACRDRNLACPYSGSAALVLGAFVSDKFSEGLGNGAKLDFRIKAHGAPSSPSVPTRSSDSLDRGWYRLLLLQSGPYPNIQDPGLRPALANFCFLEALSSLISSWCGDVSDWVSQFRNPAHPDPPGRGSFAIQDAGAEAPA